MPETFKRDIRPAYSQPYSDSSTQAQERVLSRSRSAPGYHAYRTLQFAFAAIPIIAGIDKFLHLLVDWNVYLSPLVPQYTGITAENFMKGVGVIEILAGVGVALKPKFFAYIVSAWLLGIVANLLTTGQYFDIALRDFGLMLGAFALARLSHHYDFSRKYLRSV